MAKTYLGMKNANDLAGAAVRLTRPVQNGLGQMPAGATGTITNAAGYVKNGNLHFLADKCNCCGLQFKVSGLSYSDFELITPVIESAGVIEFAPNITPLFTVANQVLANFFKVEAATNYISHIIEDRDTGDEYIITMQKVSGETPLQQLATAKDRIAHLEHALAQALELSLRDSEHFGGKRTDIAARIKESLNPAAIAGGDDYSDSTS